MSNIYALEPHTNAKVILHTTSGDIEIELWGKETPRATRNFIQLCMEGYYDNTIFHRIVPDFLVQGGDPTGTGQGGESIYDDGFPDEFHSRLRFNRRGLVGLANTGQDDNGSQFFITLDRADELTKKHTLFGRVAGDTLFNVMKMTELELENERPLYPPRIKSTEVILNPFDDIVPRITAEERRKAKEEEKKRLEEEAAAAKKKKKGKKQLNLLSFGDEAAEFVDDEPAKEKKNVHRESTEVKKNVSREREEEEKKKRLEREEEENFEREKIDKAAFSQALKEKLQRSKESSASKVSLSEKLKEKIKQSEEKQSDAVDKIKEEIRNISKPEPPVVVIEKKPEKKKSLVALEREKYATNKRRKKGDKAEDNDVFQKLMAFQKKLSSVQEVAPEQVKEKKVCQLHDIPNCESCFDASQFEEEETDEGWISHRLVFDKDLKGKDLMQRKETVDDYVVIDPRDREAKLKQEEYERKRSEKSRINPAFRKRERDNDRDDYRSKRRDDDYRRSRDDDRSRRSRYN